MQIHYVTSRNVLLGISKCPGKPWTYGYHTLDKWDFSDLRRKKEISRKRKDHVGKRWDMRGIQILNKDKMVKNLGFHMCR